MNLEAPFLPIEGYERYLVNQHGIIHDRKRKKYFTGFEATTRKKTYLRVHLTNSHGKQKIHQLHRLIATAFIPNPNNYPYIDHIDKNSLNNSLGNLRWCTPKQNSQNRVVCKTSTSLYMGVSWSTKHGKWAAGIKVNGVAHNLGLHSTEDLAALAYNSAATQHGFMHLNAV